MKISATATVSDIPSKSEESVNHLADATWFPRTVWIFSAAFVLLYLPVIVDTAKYWATNDNYSHGFLVIPCSLYLTWLQRDLIKTVKITPTLWGLPLLILGLGMQVGSYILQIKYVGMWSIVPTLAGAILLLYGPAMWKLCSFPVLFTLFGAPFSNTILTKITNSLEGISTTGSFSLMSFCGYTVAQHGNVISVPGATLEIANACSGFHSIISMLAFASIYTFLFADTLLKRFVILAVTLPIAVIANILRISLLVVAATYGGMHGYHLFHDPAAIAEIVLDFVILVTIGRSLGCDTLRFAPRPVAP